MLAWIDYSIPKLYNAKSIFLLVVFLFLAFMVSSLSPLKKQEQDRLVLVYPALIFVYWLFFQMGLMSLDPHVHYYLGPTGVYTWRTNSGICYAFGAAFLFAFYEHRGLNGDFMEDFSCFCICF